MIGSTLWGDGRQSGLGVELGYLLSDAVLLSIGYNLFGFHDSDLSTDEFTQRGVYLRMRMKLDEEWLGRRFPSLRGQSSVAETVPASPESAPEIAKPPATPGKFEPVAPGETTPTGPVRVGGKPGEE